MYLFLALKPRTNCFLTAGWGFKRRVIFACYEEVNLAELTVLYLVIYRAGLQGVGEGF